MRWVVILPLLVAGCVSAPKVAGPPLPPMPKVAPRFAPLATTVTAPTKTYWLRWSYNYADQDASAIVFNIRSIETNRLAAPSYQWQIVGVTNSLCWPVKVNPLTPCAWFTVTASNTLTGLESPFATASP